MNVEVQFKPPDDTNVEMVLKADLREWKALVRSIDKIDDWPLNRLKEALKKALARVEPYLTLSFREDREDVTGYAHGDP